MSTLVWGGLIAAAVLIAAIAMQRRGGVRADGRRPVLIGAMLRRRGVSLAGLEERGLADDLANCARICRACENRAACGARLQATQAPAYRDICPNSAFIDGLRA
ncbi:MAG: DUF6455 family protein [Marivibrio sp.]|uniref:DUF6455 family protein n=1 Tax=Marivibrio sp. TaxID=2039719 RepID=UPI0032EFD9C5